MEMKFIYLDGGFDGLNFIGDKWRFLSGTYTGCDVVNCVVRGEFLLGGCVRIYMGRE